MLGVLGCAWIYCFASTGWDSVLLLGAILFHLYMAPYTKVEESFNVQVGTLHPLSFPFPLQGHITVL